MTQNEFTGARIPLSEDTSRILQRASAQACKFGHEAVLPAHVLLALLDQMPKRWDVALSLVDLARSEVSREILSLLPTDRRIQRRESSLMAKATHELMAGALACAISAQSNEVRPVHLVSSLLDMHDGIVSAALAYRARFPAFRDAVLAETADDPLGNKPNF